MRGLVQPVLIALMGATLGVGAQSVVAPDGVLRVSYLANNPAQATKDPATGETRGVAVDLARELARRLGTAVNMIGAPNPQAVIDAVATGQADVGFVAYNPERAGPVEFSQPYMLVQQTFLVRQDSPIRSVADIDRPQQKIGAPKGDSIALYLARTLKQAELVEITETKPGEANEALVNGRLHALGSNRQRLTAALKNASGLRVLPDDLYGVEQTLIVPRGRSEALNVVNRFIDDVRRSGFLGGAIERSGVVGIGVAPAAVK